ncbi:hypothetical protein ACFWYW_24105 [Nonomuraea sp. NPDC059023]|uniref:hypothetical protein n=1 Tax=unclassified Nonomuraea TaxID=2593643 RepID=UPI00369FBCA3
MTTTKPLVFAVAGAGESSTDNTWDLLTDWLEDDPEREVALYLPADLALTSKAVVDVAEWAEASEVSYTALAAPKPGRRGKLVLASCARSEETMHVADDLIQTLADAQRDGKEAVLVLAWGESDEAPDEDTGTLFDQAVAAGIPVKDLTAGLDDLAYTDDPPVEDSEEEHPDDVDDDAAPPSGEPAELEQIEQELTLQEPSPSPRPDQGAAPAEEEAAPADEAQAIPPAPAPRPADVPDLLTTLAFTIEHLTQQDHANAARRMEPVHLAPLTRAVRHHFQRLNEELNTQAAPSQDPQPPAKARGKARDTAADQVTVLIDEDKQTIRLAGRGRPRKGETKREMTRAEYEAFLSDFDQD